MYKKKLSYLDKKKERKKRDGKERNCKTLHELKLHSLIQTLFFLLQFASTFFDSAQMYFCILFLGTVKKTTFFFMFF